MRNFKVSKCVLPLNRRKNIDFRSALDEKRGHLDDSLLAARFEHTDLEQTTEKDTLHNFRAAMGL